MHDVLRFWLDRGVDGFRMDVIHCIGKDPALPDDPPELAALSHVPLNDRPETHELLQRIRGVLDEYPGDRMSVGEVYLLDTKRVVSYLGDGDELHLVVQLPAAVRAVGRGQVAPPDRDRRARARPGRRLADLGAVEPRQPAPPHALRLRGPGPRRGGAAAHPAGHAVPLRRRGARPGRRRRSRADRVVDPGGRDGCRAPIPWDAEPGHGWAGRRPVAALAARRRHAQRRVRAGRPDVDPAPLPAGARRPAGPRPRCTPAT